MFHLHRQRLVEYGQVITHGSINVGLVAGIETANWAAMVAIKWASVCLWAAVREKKKLAASPPESWKSSAIVCKMADFPEPAGALIQRIRVPFASSKTQLSMSLIMAFWVSLWHFGASWRSLESCIAPAAILPWRSWRPETCHWEQLIYEMENQWPFSLSDEPLVLIFVTEFPMWRF